MLLAFVERRCLYAHGDAAGEKPFLAEELGGAGREGRDGISEFVRKLAVECGISQDESDLCVDVFIDTMKKALLEGNRIEVRGFGSFCMKEYGEYTGRNPKTCEKVRVRPKRLPFFRAGKELKEHVNDGD